MASGTTYLALLRGINVGGRNKVPMEELRALLERLGLESVSTWIQSGNAIFRSSLDETAIAPKIEAALSETFRLDSDQIRVLVLSHAALRAIVDHRPTGFGDEPSKYHSDAIFLVGLSPDEALTAFVPREGVDTVWSGNGVLYHRRLSARRTQTRLNRVMAHPLYQSMTIRSWSTTIKLLELMDAAAA